LRLHLAIPLRVTGSGQQIKQVKETGNRWCKEMTAFYIICSRNFRVDVETKHKKKAERFLIFFSSLFALGFRVKRKSNKFKYL
jgi:hypothetical protein